MSETPYYDAYMRGERSNNFFYNKLLKQLDSERINDMYTTAPSITYINYVEGDWRHDD